MALTNKEQIIKLCNDINKKEDVAKAARDKRVSDLTPKGSDDDNQGGNGNGESQIPTFIPVATRTTVAQTAQATPVVAAATTGRQTRRSAQAVDAEINADVEAQNAEVAATETATDVVAPVQNTETTAPTTNIEDGETALAAEVPATKKSVFPWIIAAILAVVGISTEEYMRRKHLAKKAKDNK